MKHGIQHKHLGQHIRTSVADPGYFEQGQRGKIVYVTKDAYSPDGYAYHVEFTEGVYWYLDANEFELEH